MWNLSASTDEFCGILYCLVILITSIFNWFQVCEAFGQKCQSSDIDDCLSSQQNRKFFLLMRLMIIWCTERWMFSHCKWSKKSTSYLINRILQNWEKFAMVSCRIWQTGPWNLEKFDPENCCPYSLSFDVQIEGWQLLLLFYYFAPQVQTLRVISATAALLPIPSTRDEKRTWVYIFYIDFFIQYCFLSTVHSQGATRPRQQDQWC